ncbi:MAG: hypothetical protein ACYDEQ_08345 [Desulfocucumaceae bacterium]
MLPFEILTRVDTDLSVDPSYIIRYQVFEDNHLLGDGVVQYHRQAQCNNFVIPDALRCKDGNPLPGEVKERIFQNIFEAVRPYL